MNDSTLPAVRIVVPLIVAPVQCQKTLSSVMLDFFGGKFAKFEQKSLSWKQ